MTKKPCFPPIKRVALESLGFEFVVDPSMPSDEISFRDERGKEIGRIVGLKPEEGDGCISGDGGTVF